MQGFSVNSRAVFNAELGRVVYMTTLEAAEEQHETFHQTLGRALGVPGQLILDAQVVHAAAERVVDYPRRLFELLLPRYLPPYALEEIYDDWRGRWRVGRPNVEAMLYSLLSAPSRPLSPLLPLDSEAQILLGFERLPRRQMRLVLDAAITLILSTPPESERIQLERMLGYDAAYGLSPKLESRPASELVRTAKHSAYLPLLLGVEQAIVAGAQHSWGAAFLYALAGGGVTILILSTCAVGDRIVRALAGRSEIEDEDTSEADPPSGPST